MASDFFRFKQFCVWHNLCAMKVGTDGVLLGAWAMQGTNAPSSSTTEGHHISKSIDEKSEAQHRKHAEVHHILDIGTGSGLIALMLAQRFGEAKIDAIDIAPSAIQQAEQNFRQSPWSERLCCSLSALQDYHSDTVYDLIVSNPPYFQNSLKNPDQDRLLARHSDSLPYSSLLHHAAQLVAPQGIIALILPAEAEKDIIRIAETEKLFCTRLTRVCTKPGKNAKRILIEFSPIPSDQPTQPELFYIESSTSPRSEEYSRLTQDFYL